MNAARNKAIKPSLCPTPLMATEMNRKQCQKNNGEESVVREKAQGQNIGGIRDDPAILYSQCMQTSKNPEFECNTENAKIEKFCFELVQCI